MIYLYKQPVAGDELVIGADPAESHDYSAYVALSKRTAEVVMISRAKEESSQLGYNLEATGKYLKRVTNFFPTIAVERNTGAATIHVLKTLNYPNIYRMPDSFTKRVEETTDNYGWSTNVATRPKMLDDLALAIRQRAITIPSKLIVDELYSFIRHQKTGKAQAEAGSNDDLVMSLAIAWQLYQSTPSQVVNYTPPRDDITNKNWSLN